MLRRRAKIGGEQARQEHGRAMHVPFVEFQDVLRSNAVMGIAIECLGTSCVCVGVVRSSGGRKSYETVERVKSC